MANLRTSIIMDLVDRVTGPARRITSALGRLARRSGFNELRTSAGRLGTAFSTTMQRARNLTQGLAFTGAAAIGATWGAERFVSGVTNIGSAVKDTAERLGVGTTWLQEWYAVGRHFNVRNEAMADGLKELGLRADEFVMTAAGPAAEAFQRLGISPEQLRETQGNTNALFDLVLNRLRGVENFAARQRLVDEIFGGEGGEQMAEMVSATTDEVRRLMQAARDRGEILSEEDIENAREYNRNMGDLRQSIFAIRATVVGALLPSINEWVQEMGALSVANREAIAADIVAGIRDFTSAIMAVGRAIGWVANLVGGLDNLLVGLSILFGVKLAASIGRTAKEFLGFSKALVRTTRRLIPRLVLGITSLASGFISLAARAIPAAIAGIRALSVALLTTPIGWIIAGVAAVAGLAYLLYRNWDGVAAWFSNLWENIKGVFGDGVQFVKDLFSGGGLVDLGKEWIGGLWTGITERWTQMTNWLSERIDALTSWLPDWATGGIGADRINTASRPQGPAVTGPRPTSPSLQRTDVSGELRIRIDSDGRPRVERLERSGALDFSVDAGLTGLVP